MSAPLLARVLRRPLAAYAAVAPLLLGAVFSGRLAGEWVGDDLLLVARNASLGAPDGLGAVLGRDLWGGAGQEPQETYVPLTVLTFWAQARVGAVSLVAHRAVNLLVHLAVGGLLLVLLRRWRLPAGVAIAGALVFVLHPVATDRVLLATGRADLLGLLLVLAALAVWPRAGAPGARGRAIGAALLGALAVLASEPYAVVPLLVGLVAWQERNPGAGEDPAAARAHLALPVLAVAAALGLQHALGIGSGGASFAPGESARNAASVALHYFARLTSASNGPIIETYEPLGGFAAAATGLVALAAVAGLWSVRARPAGRLALFGLAWFAVMLAPHVLLLPARGAWTNGSGYGPLVGLVVAGAAGAAAASQALVAAGRRSAVLVMPALAALVLVVCAARTRAEAALWRSELRLSAASVAVDPTDGRALYHMALSLRGRFGCGMALPMFEEAARWGPGHSPAWRDLAGCLIELGRGGAAIAPARRALALAPASAHHHYTLGAALVLAGQRAEGVQALEQARRLSPGHPQATALLRRVQASPTP